MKLIEMTPKEIRNDNDGIWKPGMRWWKLIENNIQVGERWIHSGIAVNITVFEKYRGNGYATQAVAETAQYVDLIYCVTTVAEHIWNSLGYHLEWVDEWHHKIVKI